MMAKKSLGQHFLTCRWAVDSLIRAAHLSPNDTVLEIGPGTGILTRALAPRVKKVIAVEKDDALADGLVVTINREKIGNVNIIKGDILRLTQTKFRSVFDLNLVWVSERDYKVVANIPYYLTSRLLRVLLDGEARPERIVVMIQKEVAERIIAAPPRMNLLALSVQAYGTAKIIKTVPAECFLPKPKVDSAIISISDISDDFFVKNAIDKAVFFKIIRAAFGQKRKHLVNPLSAVAGGKQKAAAMIFTAGLNPRVRPQELSLQQWTDVTKLLSSANASSPKARK